MGSREANMTTPLELLGLPAVPNLVFDHPPLVLGLCQLKFGSILGIADPTFVAPFQRELQPRYPIVVPTDRIELQVGLGPEGAAVQSPRRAQTWQLGDREDNWKVVLGQDFCALETRAYDRFSEFAERLGAVLDA